MTNDYTKMIRSLIAHDEKDLIELCHDLADEKGGIEAIERISDVFYQFIEDYEPPEDDGESFEDDYKAVDDAQRAREARAINNENKTIW